MRRYNPYGDMTPTGQTDSYKQTTNHLAWKKKSYQEGDSLTVWFLQHDSKVV